MQKGRMRRGNDAENDNEQMCARVIMTLTIFMTPKYQICWNPSAQGRYGSRFLFVVFAPSRWGMFALFYSREIKLIVLVNHLANLCASFRTQAQPASGLTPVPHSQYKVYLVEFRIQWIVHIVFIVAEDAHCGATFAIDWVQATCQACSQRLSYWIIRG